MSMVLVLRGIGPDDIRTAIHGHLVEQLPLFPVQRWLPEDVEELPCAVVGRPAYIQSPEISTGMLVSTLVTVVGRRLSADDAQQELDQAMWQVMNALNLFKGFMDGTTRYQVTEATPELVSIANEEYPCYRIAVDTQLVDC